MNWRKNKIIFISSIFFRRKFNNFVWNIMLFDSFPYKIIEFSSEENRRNKNNLVFSPIHDFSLLKTSKKV
jgi:hypothetical protein